jgi:glycosyltransferase involved in cell wall biosynthesis
VTVLHVSAYFAPAFGFGGPPRSLLALCRAQRSAGLDVAVFTTTANVGPPLPAYPEGIVLHGLRVSYFPLSAPRRLFGARSMGPALEATLPTTDIVHLHGLFNRTVWMGAAAATRAGVPYVVSPRGMLEDAALAHHGRRKQVAWALFDRHVLAHAAAWHATSTPEADGLRRRPHAKPVVEIPNAVDAPGEDAGAGDAVRAAFDIPADAPVVLFLGRLHPIKRLDLLASAFDRVAAASPQAHLAIAGPDEGGHRAQVEPLFARHASRVRWCDAVDGRVKQGLLDTSTALVMCSDSESFGMSVAEGLAAGTPAVVSRTCPWAALEQERCGLWVEQSAAGLADGLLCLLGDTAAAHAMGERGRAFVARRLSAQAVGRRWVDVYREIA